MPSIFIWKSNKPNTSKKSIKVYSGSNWMLEDNHYLSKSSIFLEQIVIPNLDTFNGSVISYYTKTMPQDWVGSDLLEVTNISYELVKEDSYGSLELLGGWMRFTLKGSMNFDKDSLVSELATIINWIEKPLIVQHKQNINHKHDFKNNNKPYYKQPTQPTQNRQAVKQQSLSIDPTKVQKDFQEFLIKFDLNKYTSQLPPIQSGLLKTMQTIASTY
jgi:hypothetical protein